MSADVPALVVRQQQPFNAETPLALLAAPNTPPAAFYVRNHLPQPTAGALGWQLHIDGAVTDPQSLSLSEVLAMPQQTRRVTLECAGNGRAFMARPAEGLQWTYGATATAEFTGTPLRPLLDRAGVSPDTAEILFAGADRGEFEPGARGAYERSLPLEFALSDDVLLAWAMDGQPLAPEHGAPLRLLVPGWYGMASVKWLERIAALTEPFAGYWQHRRYVYEGEQGLADGTPVTTMRVRAIIAQPLDGAQVPLAPLPIVGSAWSGSGPVTNVEVSADGGHLWQPASLTEECPRAAAATGWRARWQPPAAGAYTIMARATDSAGNVQPMAATWNRFGYANNAVQQVHIIVSDDVGDIVGAIVGDILADNRPGRRDEP